LTDVERIVREVLAQLGVAPAAAEPPPAPAPPAQTPAPRTDELVLTGRVITMEAVAERLNAVRRVVVPRRAIVTPAVQDELRRRNVALVHAAETKGKKADRPRLVLVAARTRRDPAALVRAMADQGVGVESHSSDCLIKATDQLAGELAKPNTLGLLWTRHTALGLCLANRHPGVRCVLAGDVASTAAAVAAVGANLLMLDPASGTPYQHKQIVGDFCLGGVRPCPEDLKERLG
jgi:hypothetical protein